MSTSRLKFYLFVIWGIIAILGGVLALLALAGQLAAPISNALTPTFPRTPLAPSLTISPTTVIIRATQRPGEQILLPTWTPSTPLPLFQDAVAPPGINPLTGLKVADPSLLERRPIAVKIVTWPRSARAYQSGLTRADVVYEYYTENWETRFIAVFYGQDAERAGPVRSGRYFDENIMRMYHSVLVFANADDRVKRYLIDSLDLRPFLFVERQGYNCPPLCRDGRIEGYQDLFVNTAGVGAFLKDNSKQPLRPTFFNSFFRSAPVSKISRIYTHYSPFSYNYWEYDPAQRKYLRYSDAKNALEGQSEVYTAHIDRLTDQQISADNVVELVVPHLFKNDYDRADQLFDIQIIGGGDAYIFIDGNMYKGSWDRDLLDQPFQLFDQEGKLFSLKPGVTYYQIIDPESTIDQNGLSITFNFFIPPRVFTPTPTPTRFKPTPTRRSHE